MVPSAVAEVTNLKLSDTLTSPSRVESFKISPDSGVVVYQVTPDFPFFGVINSNIFSVPLTGGTVTKLNDSSTTEGGVLDYDISSDGRRVVYLDPDQGIELFSVPLVGGAALKINDVLPIGGSVVGPPLGDVAPPGLQDYPGPGFEISPDSSRVVYMVRYIPDDSTTFELIYEIYSVSMTGGGAIKLNDTLVRDGHVSKYQISPDSGRVVYMADQEVKDTYELYSVPLTGGAVTKLNDIALFVYDPNAPSFPGFRVSPDSQFVVYWADPDGDFRYELFSVPLAGGPVVKLNGTLVSGSEGVQFFEISPDGSRVIYRADQETAEVIDLYSVPLDGGVAVKLNDGAASGSGVAECQISPDGRRVAYRLQQPGGGWEMFSAPLEGGASVRLDGATGSGGWTYLQISPDGSRVGYHAPLVSEGDWGLYGVPLGGGSPDKLSDVVLSQRRLYPFLFSPDSGRVIYRSGGELFSVSLSGGSPVKLNGPMAGDGGLESFQISMDGRAVVYRASQDDEDVVELYTTFPISTNAASPRWSVLGTR